MALENLPQCMCYIAVLPPTPNIQDALPLERSSVVVATSEEPSFWHSRTRYFVVSVVVAIGFLSAWIGRYSMNPDGMCYLDMGDAFFHHKWFDFLNGYWSPLYSWLVGLALFVIKPSRTWEFPVVQAVNFFIYAAALASFEFFLRSLARVQGLYGDRFSALSQRSLFVLGYALFLWTSLNLITIWGVSPDLLVAACIYLITGLLLRMRSNGSVGLYIAFGAVLAVGYLSKAVMFPLGWFFLLIGLIWVPKRQRISFAAAAMVAFLALSAPWLIALSHAKGRFDFGDSGWLNYSALVSPGGRVLNWQGDPPASGIPLHPTRQIHRKPAIFEFAAPVGGTYPPSFDPSYWNEGRRWTFNLRTQLTVVAEHSLFYAEIFLRDQPGVLAATIALLFVTGAASRSSMLRQWPLFALCFVPMALYALVHAETRFIAAQVTIFWMALLSGVRLDNSEKQRLLAECMVWAASATVLLSVLDGTAREIRAGGFYSARDQIVVANELERAGLRDGDDIAVLGDGNWSYWARLARLKIVSTIIGPDTEEFWAQSPEQKAALYQLFLGTGARAVVANHVPSSERSGWRRIGNSEYYLRWLSLSNSGAH